MIKIRKLIAIHLSSLNRCILIRITERINMLSFHAKISHLT